MFNNNIDDGTIGIKNQFYLLIGDTVFFFSFFFFFLQKYQATTETLLVLQYLSH